MEDKITLSPSRARKWIRCKKSYYWRYYQHLTRIQKGVPMSLGSVASETLAGYYSRPDRTQVSLDDCLARALDNLSPHPDVLRKSPSLGKDWNKITNVSHYLFSKYHDWAYPKDTGFEMEAVERSQQVELTSNISLLAIPDAIVSQDGSLLVFEHKVRSRYHSGDFGIDYQSVGSCLVSGSIGTLYNVLEYSHAKFYREPIVRSEEELDYFRNIYIRIGEEILSTPPEYLYPQPFKRCSCEYWELCNAEMTGLDLDDIIGELYQKSIRPKEKEEVGETEGGG